MIRRLVEAHYFENQKHPTPPQIRFWLQELRTSELLLELAQRHPATCRRLTSKRPLLSQVISGESMNLSRRCWRRKPPNASVTGNIGSHCDAS